MQDAPRSPEQRAASDPFPLWERTGVRLVLVNTDGPSSHPDHAGSPANVVPWQPLATELRASGTLDSDQQRFRGLWPGSAPDDPSPRGA